MKKRKIRFTKLKCTILFIVLFFLFLIAFLSFNLERQLYEMQKEKRLQKVEDFNMFEISYHEQNRCQKKEIFVYQDVSYSYDCLENVFVSFGSTKITLKEAITKNYITLDMILQKMMKWEYDIPDALLYTKKKTTFDYQIIVRENDGMKYVTISKLNVK